MLPNAAKMLVNFFLTCTWRRLRTWVFEVQTQSQRKDVAQRAIGPGGGGCECWGGGEKFSHGMVRSRKPPLLVPLTITAITTLFSYQGTCTIQHRCTAFNNIPRPPIKSIDDLTSTDKQREQTNKQANIRPLLTPRAIARGACGHSPSTTKYYLAAWITTHGFLCLLSMEWCPLERA